MSKIETRKNGKEVVKEYCQILSKILRSLPIVPAACTTAGFIRIVRD